MAQLHILFLPLTILVAALPVAFAFKINWEFSDVKIPMGLMLALHHNHQRCSRPPVNRAPSRRSIANEHNKMKNTYPHLFHVTRGVDFTGSWIMSKIKGDMDKLLQKMGLDVMERQAARRFDYGIGHVEEFIAQDDDDFAVKVKTESGYEEVHYQVGAQVAEKHVGNPVGNRQKVERVTCKSEWADNEKKELVINSGTSSTGKALPQLRRSLVGDKMVVKMILDDTKVSVIYKRK